jgi:hypothetical protein
MFSAQRRRRLSRRVASDFRIRPRSDASFALELVPVGHLGGLMPTGVLAVPRRGEDSELALE